MRELAIGYCRVSTKKQEKQGLSLDAQEDYIKNFVSGNDYDLVKVFKVQESGGDSERKHLTKAFAYCTENDIKHILITDSDRWTRSREMDVEAQKFIKKHALKVHIIREKIVIGQFGSVAEKLFHNIMIDVAESRRDEITEKVLTGIEQKLKRGEFPSTPPLGYRSISKTERRPHRIIQTDAAPKMKQLLELFNSGKFTVRQAIKLARDIGLKPQRKETFTKGALAKLIGNRFYYGEFEYSLPNIDGGKSKVYENKTHGFEPIITKKVWAQNQAILKKRQRNLKGRGKSFTFNSLVTCGKCGGAIFGERFDAAVKYKTKKGLKVKKYDYPSRYHCNKNNFFTASGSLIPPNYIAEHVDKEKLQISKDITYWEEGEKKVWRKEGTPVEVHVCDMPTFWEKELEQMLMDEISLIKFKNKHWEKVKKDLFKDETKEFLDFEIRNLREEQTKSEIQLDSMYKDFKNEVIDAEFFKSRSKQIRERQKEAKERLAELVPEREAYDDRIGKVIEALDAFKNWEKIFKEADVEKRIHLIRLLTIKISTVYDKTEIKDKMYETKRLAIEFISEVEELFEIGLIEADKRHDEKHNYVELESVFNSPKFRDSRSDH